MYYRISSKRTYRHRFRMSYEVNYITPYSVHLLSRSSLVELCTETRRSPHHGQTHLPVALDLYLDLIIEPQRHCED